MFANLGRWARSTLEAAGFAKWGLAGLVARVFGVFALAAAVTFINSRMLVFSVCLGVLAAALAVEMLSARGASRQREISKLWPEVLDSLASAEAAGLDMASAFDDLAEHAAPAIKQHFVRACARLHAGYSLDEVLVALKGEVGSVYADRMFELLRLVNQFGSRQYHAMLREQARNLRADLALMASVEAKQSWVLGIAKLAIAAPWLIVAVLASRAENRDVYASSAGGSTLLLGLVISAFAYYLTHLMGSLPTVRRVLR